MADLAQMEAELQASKGAPQPPQGQVPPTDPALAGQPAAQDPSMGADPEQMAAFGQHMDSLPDNQKQIVAKFLSPELAQVFGICFGAPIFQYFNELADPNITLVPVPKDVAEQQMGQTNSSEGIPPQGQPPAQPMPQQAPGMQKPPMGTDFM